MTTHRPARFALSSLLLTAAAALAFAGGCADDADVEDGELDSAAGKADSMAEGSAEALAVLRLVNDPAVTKAELDDDGGLSARVAGNIVNARNGADRVAGTGDDNPFDTLAELDAIPYVGPRTLEMLLEYARSKGLLDDGLKIEAVFSPQPAASTHTKRIAQLIRDAKHSVDIAMYSYSDAEVGTALAEAVQRGIKVRFLFETANEDRKIVDLAARRASKSGRLEQAGVDVRYVNKILHHKLAIIDGPRDVAERAASATLVTGSANWSFTAAQSFDENTLFIGGAPGLATAYQHEFDLLWAHSRDFQLATALPFELSSASLPAASDPGASALFTSPNFKVTPTGTTFSFDYTKTEVADALVAAIEAAQDSIHIASGHFRLRPVAEALIAKKQADPSIDIKVYLDQQEFISRTGDDQQEARVSTCLAGAGNDPRTVYDCTRSDYLYGKYLADAGIDVRYKVYSYRWDHSYAVQMHHKYVVIDGAKLISGSYNLSYNAEHGTFENMLVLEGAQFGGVISAYERNFSTIWDTGRAGDRLAALRTQISTASSIPLVFDSLAVSWQEYNDLKTLIRSNCAVVDSTEYRDNPTAHRSCPR